MTDSDFRALCNTFGFAPSRALRELIDCVRAQEIEACAKVCDNIEDHDGTIGDVEYSDHYSNAIRARKEKT